MALFQKLFPSKHTHNKNEDKVSEKLFAFTKEQVRVMLFRECDFRGRKLLFDSKAVNKIPLDSNSSAEFKDGNESINTFTEVSSGYGYRFTKPHPEFSQIAEMVFGSVALSFRGTYFKIHSLSSPNRLMFTQIFPSPQNSARRKVNVSSRQSTASQSFQHSIAKLDDSGASSNTSTSERLSERSTASDTLLVCRKNRSSSVEVSKNHLHSLSNISIVDDSGCGDQSYTSFSSFSNSVNTLDCNNSNNGVGVFSFGCLYKRWLRSRSTSLDHSAASLNTSTEEFSSKHHHRNTKVALSLIVQLIPGQEENLTLFLMEHVLMLESILWRSRQTVDLAYCHPHIFFSSMLDVAHFCAQWLVNLLSGRNLRANLWLSLSSTCDINNSISAFNANNGLLLNKSPTALEVTNNNNSSRINFNFSFMSSIYLEKSSLFSFNSLFRNECNSLYNTKNSFNEDRNIVAEKFLKDFCELVNTIDVKGTNFFMSTLLTAVLTHHLGWVSTCTPTSEKNSHHKEEPFNLLWGQLSDLFGAVGYPTKMAQTVITSTNKKETVTKILNSLTYFIRCCDFERNFFTRVDVDEENRIVEGICLDNSFIPKENYKKYEDHLREMMEPSHFLRKTTPVDLENENIEMKTFSNSLDNCCKEEISNFNEGPKKVPSPKLSINRNQSCLGNLSQLKNEVGINKSEENCCDENIQILKKMNLYRKPSCSNFNDTNSILDETIQNDFCNDGSKLAKDCDSNVIFLLGDNEELVNIKKEEHIQKQPEEKRTLKKSLGVKNNGMKKVKSSKNFKNLQEVLVESGESIQSNQNIKNKRPTYLNLSKNKNRSLSHDYTGIFKDEDFSKYNNTTNIKPSTSWTALNLLDAESTISCSKEVSLEVPSVKLVRAQSEPPEIKEKEEKPDVIKSKYRYSGYKFTLQQYPQILENYLKSKNFEIASFQFGDKTGFKQFHVAENGVSTQPEDLDSNDEEIETLQTPSNASEMEFATDLMIEKPRVLHARESSAEPVPQYSFIRTTVPNTIVKGNSNRKVSVWGDNFKTERKVSDASSNCKIKILHLPMPKSTSDEVQLKTLPYTKSLMRDVNNIYMPNAVLQGITLPKTEWEPKLKSDLALTSQHSLLDEPIEEAVAIVANLDTWEVQLMSSHTYVIDKGTTGIRVGMSQLVANMLESLVHMWKLNASPSYCLMYIEQRLQELCVRSKALAQLLLATEFCSMEQLTSTLQLEVNDVPLLMAAASVHSPQVTQKYGLSFQ